MHALLRLEVVHTDYKIRYSNEYIRSGVAAALCRRLALADGHKTKFAPLCHRKQRERFTAFCFQVHVIGGAQLLDITYFSLFSDPKYTFMVSRA